MGKKPDPITYDPASKHIFCINHGAGTVSVIDPAVLDKDPVEITVGGTLETAVADGAGHVYVNVEDKGETVAIDSLANKILAHWTLAAGATPTGLAIDTEHHRLFVGCGNRKMYVLDSQSGKVLAAVDVGRGVDGAAYDAKLGVAMTANGRDGRSASSRRLPLGSLRRCRRSRPSWSPRPSQSTRKSTKPCCPATCPTARAVRRSESSSWA